MGTMCCCLNQQHSGLDAGNWISIAAIIVNALLAGWIIITIQSKLSNRRVLKDHFIAEIKDIRTEYRTCLNNLYLGKTHAKNIVPWFKLMNIRIEDLMFIINKKYKIPKKLLDPYQNELRDLITENTDFIEQYKSPKPIVFTDTSKNLLMIFQQKHSHLFNTIIIQINDAG